MVAPIWNTSGNLISVALENGISESSSQYLPKMVVLYAISDSPIGQIVIAFRKNRRTDINSCVMPEKQTLSKRLPR